MAFYGAAAVAYKTYGTQANPGVYEQAALEEFARLEAALNAAAVPDEPNPARLIWHC